MNGSSANVVTASADRRMSMNDNNPMHAIVRYRKYAWYVLVVVIALLWATGSDLPNL